MTSPTTVLQRLTLPDPTILGDEALFWTRSAGVYRRQNVLEFTKGAEIDLGAYFNLFHPIQWANATDLDDFALELQGSGTLTIRLSAHFDNSTSAVIVEKRITLPHRLTLPRPQRPEVWSLALFADTKATLTAANWSCNAPIEPNKIALSITTFKREFEVTQTLTRLTRMIDQHALENEVQIIVVDNGQSLSLPPHPSLILLPNRNLGGSGGFARAMLHAKQVGATHCLFMDDDAACLDESLLRCFAFLKLAKDRHSALCGAMIGASNRTQMWEYGAQFHTRCFPQFMGTDLTEREAVIEMELSAARPKSPNHYGGWWFFAFPLGQAKILPYPFFVRGDDISFSLANEFRQVTLGGVVSVQEDFSDKESPQTQYLDLRNHLTHHLTIEKIEMGRIRTARLALRFIGRSLLRMHYDTCEALLLAWQDVLEKPDLFAADPEARVARAKVAALITTERWRNTAMPSGLLAPRRNPLWKQALSRLTFNGHLVPFWSWLAPKTAIHPNVRSQVWPVMITSGARLYDRSGTRAYTVTHSKSRFFSIGLRALLLASRWCIAYPTIKAKHRAAYAQATTSDYWFAEFSKPLK